MHANYHQDMDCFEGLTAFPLTFTKLTNNFHWISRLSNQPLLGQAQLVLNVVLNGSKGEWLS